MEDLDLQKAQRVWQRVQGRPIEDPLPQLRRLAEECDRDARQPAKQSRGPGKAPFSPDGSLRHQTACLRGIQRLRAGEPVPLRGPIGKQLRLYHLLQTAAADPEYGPIYTDLAKEVLKNIRHLLEQTGK